MLASTFYLIIAGVVGVAALGGVGGGVLAGFRRKSAARKRYLGLYAPGRDGTLPGRVNSEIDGLREDLERLLDLKELTLAKLVGSIIGLTQELFSKFKYAENTHAAALAAVNYSDVLSKLNRALSDDYYFDMLAKPAMWSRVEERKRLVFSATEAIELELIQAIRDYNSQADIHHDVSLESVLRRTGSGALLNDLLSND